MASTKRGSADQTRPSPFKAFEHGSNAAGAKLVQIGWGLTPDDDLAYALGYPAVRRTVDGHPDDEVTNTEALAELVYTMPYAVDVPRNIAIIAARAIPVLRSVHVRSVSVAFDRELNGKQIDPLLRNRQALTPDEAQHLIAAEVSKPTYLLASYQFIWMLVLESLLGPDLVADALVRAIAKLPSEMICEREQYRCQWGFYLGVALLRVPVAKSKEHRKTLSDVMKSATRKSEYESDSLAEGLDYALRGAELLRKGKRPDGNQFLYGVTEAPDLVAGYLRKIEKDDSFFCDARLATLAGENGIRYYASHWKWVKTADSLRAIPPTFGRMRSPDVVRWMVELAATSKIKREAIAWLTTHATHARPIVELMAKKPGAASGQQAKQILAKLPG